MIYIVDTYAWIEYFEGSKKGGILKSLIEQKNNKLVTMECCLAELIGYALKHNTDFTLMYKLVKMNSVILPVLTSHWLEAAKIKSELRVKIAHFGLIDAILVAKQKELKCKLVSGDPHFKSLKDILYIGD